MTHSFTVASCMTSSGKSLNLNYSGYEITTRMLYCHSWDLSGRGTTRAEDAQGTPTQNHTSPNALVYADMIIL